MYTWILVSWVSCVLESKFVVNSGLFFGFDKAVWVWHSIMWKYCVIGSPESFRLTANKLTERIHTISTKCEHHCFTVSYEEKVSKTWRQILDNNRFFPNFIRSCKKHSFMVTSSGYSTCIRLWSLAVLHSGIPIESRVNFSTESITNDSARNSIFMSFVHLNWTK